MTIRIRPGFGWLRRAGTLLFLCTLLGCAYRAHKFELQLPKTDLGSPEVYPWRVGVVVDKQFTPYKVMYRYWSSTPFWWSLQGLPDAFAETLRRYFRLVETVGVGPSPSEER